MSPIPPLWEAIAAPYRSGDLHECVRLARATVDAQPYDLPPRYLLAALYMTLEEPGLALLQYERLLPLAVGRGEMFLALAAQRRLDELHPPITLHERRYHAMHQWFVSLARSERRRRSQDAMRAFGPQVLVRLGAAEFARASERCRVESLGMNPREVVPENGLLWVVLHGRLRWAVVREGEPAGDVTIAEPGDFIVLPSASKDGPRLHIEPDTPAECLCLDPELFSAVREPGASHAGPAPSATAESADDEQVADLVAAAAATADADALAEASSAAPPASREVARGPRPDPMAEPMVAVGAPIERRRENRLSVQAANGVVLLGLAGTRVAPLPGALLDLSVSGLSVRFRRGDVLQACSALRESVVAVHLSLPGEGGAERLAARVAWVDREPAATDPESALSLGLEFVAMSPAQQARIEPATLTRRA